MFFAANVQSVQVQVHQALAYYVDEHVFDYLFRNQPPVFAIPNVGAPISEAVFQGSLIDRLNHCKAC